MDDKQTTGPATDTHLAQASTDTHAAQASTDENGPNSSPGFGERGRMRRRMRFLRKARELAYRDLGGLVFDLHRYGQRNDALVLAKLETIGRIDTELRALEGTLSERRAVTVLREAGVAACPRCAAIHGSDDRFCPNCGLAMDLRAERPMAGPQSAAPATPTPPPATAAAPAPVSAPPATSAPLSAPTPPASMPSPPTTSMPTPAIPTPSQPTTSTPTPTTPTEPAPHTPPPRGPSATPDAPPGASAPARDDAPVPAASPASDGDAAPTGAQPDTPSRPDASTVDEPTEIVRPPIQNP